MTRTLPLFSLVLWAAAAGPGCAPSATIADVPMVSTALTPARPALQVDVLEAVYRHQLDHNASGRGRSVDFFFLALDEGADPPTELLERFAGESPVVLPVSLAAPERQHGVEHRAHGGEGLIFKIETVGWINEDTAQVRGGYYAGPLSASINVYRVERQSGGWKVTRDWLLAIS